MRDIDANALAAINQQFGLEAINIVRVYWNQSYIDYCDKAEMEHQYDNVQARIIEISGMDNIISMDRGSASTSITVKLDDSDGVLLNIVNSADMQKRPVQILQWFTNAPTSDAFILFTGEITTPLEWSEGERTLTFTVISKVENIELGFSLEEGVIEGIPVNMWGKPFPIVFGTVYKSPALMIGDSPSGILAEGFVYLNSEVVNLPLDDLSGSGASPVQSTAQLGNQQSGNKASENSTSGGIQSQGNGQEVLGITVYQYEINKLYSQLQKIYKIAQQLYRQSILVEVLAASYNSGDNGAVGNPENYETYKKYHQQSQQLYRQVQQYSVQYFEMLAHLDNLIADYDQKKAFAFNPVPVYSQTIPQTIPLIIEIGKTRFDAQYNGTEMYLFDQILPPNLPPERVSIGGIQETYVFEQSVSTQEQKKYIWFDAGSKVRVINLPMYYIACQGTTNDIVTVYGRSYGVRVPLPPELFSVAYYPFTNGDGVTIWATVIIVNQPLTTLYDNTGTMMYQTDEIWCDIISSVQGALVPILLWTIANYTHENVSDIGPLTADETSFNLVNTYTNVHNNPMNFTVVDRKNVIDFMKEICLQARTCIWIDNGVVKLRYLPADPGLDPEIVITPDDVVENSLVICTDDTELLKTKIIGKWRPNMDQEIWNEIIERVNIGQYGVLTETIEFYCFQFAQLVQRAAGYWAQRWGHTWKKVKLKTHIGKLQLEGQDPVGLNNFNNLFATGNCVGIVETAKYDSQNLQMELEIWLPILWGTMVPYVWAYPKDVTIYYGPQYIEYNTFNPFQGAFDDHGLLAQPKFVNYQAPPFPSGPHQLNDTPPDLTFDTALTTTQPSPNAAIPGAFDTATRPTGLQLANTIKAFKIKPPVPVNDAVPDAFDMGIVLAYLMDVTLPAATKAASALGNSSSQVNSQMYSVQSLTTNDTSAYVTQQGYNYDQLGAASGAVGSSTGGANAGSNGTAGLPAAGSGTQGAGNGPIPTGINNPVPDGAAALSMGTPLVYNAIQIDIAKGWQVVAGTIVQVFRKAGTWYMQAPTWAQAQPEQSGSSSPTTAGNKSPSPSPTTGGGGSGPEAVGGGLRVSRGRVEP